MIYGFTEAGQHVRFVFSLSVLNPAGFWTSKILHNCIQWPPASLSGGLVW